MIPLGIGLAAMVRVGKANGAGDIAAARRAGLVAFLSAFGFILICGVAMALFGRAIAGLYLGGRTQSDLDVIVLAALFLKVAAAFQVFDALQVVGVMSLRGLKDARMPMILAAGAYWLVGTPTSLLLALTFHMKGLGIWIGLATGLAAAAVLMCSRFFLLTRARAIKSLA
jgi:MATE family multidrug resistance protein